MKTFWRNDVIGSACVIAAVGVGSRANEGKSRAPAWSAVQRQAMADEMIEQTVHDGGNDTGLSFMATGDDHRTFTIFLEPPDASQCSSQLDFISNEGDFAGLLLDRGFRFVECVSEDANGKTTNSETREIVPRKDAPVAPPRAPLPGDRKLPPGDPDVLANGSIDAGVWPVEV